jgi:hypothetical protein
MRYDVIGDIHGQAGKLKALLAKLGYQMKGGAYRHPEGRMAIFVGDLIDRGPDQVETVNIVRRMIDAGTGRSIMGNHELNAIAFMTPDPATKTEFMRPHNKKNIAQHAEFLRQVGEGSSLHDELIDWFKTLPPYLDLGDIRVVHAWWNQAYVDLVVVNQGADGRMKEEFLYAGFKEGDEAFEALEGLTKGLEIRLPNGSSFFDHGGVEREHTRTKWWHHDATNYREVVIVPEEQMHRIPEHPLPAAIPLASRNDPPVFVGHYWFVGTPTIQTPRVAVLDYSAAKSGPLVAYRWEGEADLVDTGFVGAG